MIVTEQKFSPYQQQPNAGQVARLKLLPIDAVLALSPPGAGHGLDGPTTNEPLTVSKYGLAVSGGSPLTELVFPVGACTFTETSSRDPAGTVYSPELQATIPRNQPGLLNWLDQHKAHRWLALWLDRNGLAYVAGEPGNGLRMEISRAVGAGNSVAVSLKGRYLHTTWFLETFDSSVLFADVEFSTEFDFSFNA
jgi:hypothetical protein